MRKAFKTWYFYLIYLTMMLIGYYILDFVNDIPDTFPTASPWSAVNWITAIGLALIALITSIFFSLVLQQAKRNFEQQKNDHKENKKMYENISKEFSHFVIEIRRNYENDLALRKDFNDLSAVVKDHEDRISKLENK